jgi:hypothetical protein
MTKAKVSVSDALKEASVSKVEGKRKNQYRVDLEEAHAYTLDVSADSAGDALDKAREHMNAMPDSILPGTLKKDS